MMRFLYLLFLALTTQLVAQKQVYLPLYLQNPNNVDGAQFTWSKTAQSKNFIMIWGNTVGTNPANYPDPNLAFDPAKILDTMEFIYTEFKALGFLDDSPGTNLAQYKVPIVMYGTWGPNGAQGWANGGSADGVIGAFWVHPNAMHDGGVAAHEFAHSMQAQNDIDIRPPNGLGPAWSSAGAGIFWETHANFMRNLLYPQAVTAWGMDVYHLETWGDWKNTYENYALLFGIMESEGIDMVNRLWRESYDDEYPLQAYKRLADYTQAQFNDSLFHYARRMATYDFSYKNVGSYFRQYRNADLNNWLPTVQNCYTILRQMPGSDPGRYEIPIEQAPEEFSYNIIPLYPNADSCSVIVRFKGHTEANAHTGWRYGFVAAKADGTVSRYSPTYSANTGEIAFRLQGNETKIYLVVMGAPHDGITTNTSNDTWYGYPKHFRFPYEVNISGAVPEGYQPAANFRTSFRTNGHAHSNGGGWVQNSATVASSVYVGPMAMVLGNANISGTVRIEGTSIVRNAAMSGNVRVLGNAVVDGGTYSQNAKVQGNAHVINATMSGSAMVGMRARVDNYNLSGNIEVGGDVVVYNDQGNCNNGVYYRLTNYYDNKLLECDGRTASHPANADVNSAYAPFSNADMALQCQCAGLDSVVVDSVEIAQPTCTNPAGGSVQFHISSNCGPFQYAWSNGTASGQNLDGLSAGSYSFTITDALDRQGLVSVEILNPPALTATVFTTPFNCESTSGGTAKVEITSGTTPFQYEWTNGETSDEITNLVPVEYAITVTDALGCTFTAIADIQLAGQITAYLDVTSVDCTGNMSGGSIKIINFDGTAPYWYQWSNGETTASLANLSPGTYSVTATDAFGCSFHGTKSVGISGQLNATLAETPIFCNGITGGTVSIELNSGTAPFSIEWSNGATTTTVNDLSTGTYSVTATDAFGCSFTGAAAVELSGQLGVSLHATQVSCFGLADGTAAISPIGGTAPFTWLWADGQTDSLRTGLGAGDYAATLSDASGCAGSLAFTLTAPDSLALQIAPANITCFGASDGSASVMATGGTPSYAYLWSNGGTTADLVGLAAGNYAVTVSDANGCIATASAAITEPPMLSLEPIVQNASCFGVADGTAAVMAEGGTPGYTYVWDNGQTGDMISGLTTGIYAVTVTDANGCAAAAGFPVGPIAALQLSIEATPAFVCPNATGELVATASGGTSPYSYSWSNGSAGSTLTDSVGNYGITVTDFNGCTLEQVVEMSEVPFSLDTLIVNASAANAADGAIYLLSLMGGTPLYSYNWSTGSTTLETEGLMPGDYTVTISDEGGCEWVYTFTVGVDLTATTDNQSNLNALIAPNPSSSHATLLLDLPQAQTLTVTVSDVLGRTLYSEKAFLQAGKNSYSLPQSLVAGVYWVSVKTVDGKQRAMKWVVE